MMLFLWLIAQCKKKKPNTSHDYTPPRPQRRSEEQHSYWRRLSSLLSEYMMYNIGRKVMIRGRLIVLTLWFHPRYRSVKNMWCYMKKKIILYYWSFVSYTHDYQQNSFNSPVIPKKIGQRCLLTFFCCQTSVEDWDALSMAAVPVHFQSKVWYYIFNDRRARL